MSEGFVQALWRFPVVAMGGERLRSTQVDTRGVAGDRQHFLIAPDGPLTLEDAPGLASWRAAFPFNPDGAIVPDRPPPWPVLSGPGGVKSWRWGDPRLGYALERSLGHSVELVRDIESTRGVIVATVAPEQPPEVAGINVQLSLDLPPQPGWHGRELVFRDGVRLRMIASRADGPGIETRVVATGRIVLGEPVTLS